MLPQYDLIVILPLGPDTLPEFFNDTIESIYFYCSCSLKLIIADDSLQGLGELARKKFPDAEVFVNDKSGGLAGGLYITLSRAFCYALEHYRFKTLLKIDTDALVTGSNPQLDAEQFFLKNPAVGMAGLFKSGHEILDFNNNIFDNRWPRNYLFDITSTWKLIKRPIANWTVRKYLHLAFANGYNIGENIFGGAYFLSEPVLKALLAAGLLPDKNLGGSRLEEDHIFSMLVKVVNFEMGDLASGDLPFGVFWQKLPASPEELVRRKKKIVHSTRGWEHMNEYEIRSYFKKIRECQSDPRAADLGRVESGGEGKPHVSVARDRSGEENHSGNLFFAKISDQPEN